MSSQEQLEKQLSLEQQLRQEINIVEDGIKKSAMAKSFQRLTVILGKLGIAKDRLTIDWDAERTRILGGGGVSPRPPWKTGIEYGLGLAESVAWLKRYLAARKASTAVTGLDSIGVTEDEPGSI
jgi:hypothetical protein